MRSDDIDAELMRIAREAAYGIETMAFLERTREGAREFARTMRAALRQHQQEKP